MAKEGTLSLGITLEPKEAKQLAELVERANAVTGKPKELPAPPVSEGQIVVYALGFLHAKVEEGYFAELSAAGGKGKDAGGDVPLEGTAYRAGAKKD
jgi:hypothetical protein